MWFEFLLSVLNPNLNGILKRIWNTQQNINVEPSIFIWQRDTSQEKYEVEYLYNG